MGIFGGKKFDIVVMNPPYQVEDGGHSRSATPIYHKFIEKVIDELQPDYLVSINPSRWMVGGKGLDDFRKRMMADKRIRLIADDQSISGAFPNVKIAGGVNYFLWDKNYAGKCCFNGVDRNLDEEDIVIRENQSRSILKKVKSKATGWIGTSVSPRKPYGLRGDTDVPKEGYAIIQKTGVPCWFKQSIGLAFVDPSAVTNPRNDVHLWRVLAPYIAPDGEQLFLQNGVFFREYDGTRGRIIVAKPGEYCTETYLVLKGFSSEREARNFVFYLGTKLFRFMLWMRTVSQHITRENYNWVPDLKDYSVACTDAELYERFGLTRQEREYIENKIKILE